MADPSGVESDHEGPRSPPANFSNPGTQHSEKPATEPLWITSDIVHILTRATLQNAIDEGTSSWDDTIMRTLFVILQAATGARAGEILRSNGCTGNQCLRWEHINMRLIQEGEELIYTATVTLDYTKWLK